MPSSQCKRARRGGTERLFRAALCVSVFLCFCVLTAGCTTAQEGEPIVDVEPERQVNTELVFPKNPRRWAFVATRLSTDPADPFAGYRVVLANPFGGRLREEGRTASRGVKLAQFIHAPRQDEAGIVPGDLRRVNLLVQDPDRYAATGGWGYASYDGEGRPIPIDPKTDCMTCHTSGPITSYLRPPRAGRR